jgi:hypothetical protein
MQQQVPPQQVPPQFGPAQFGPPGPSFGGGPYGPGGGPRSGQVPVLLAAVLALVAAAPAVAGTFGTLLSYESTSTYRGRSNTSTSASTGWRDMVEPASGILALVVAVAVVGARSAGGGRADHPVRRRVVGVPG